MAGEEAKEGEGAHRVPHEELKIRLLLRVSTCNADAIVRVGEHHLLRVPSLEFGADAFTHDVWDDDV